MRLWRIVLMLGVWLAVAGCAAPVPSAVHSDQNGPVHGESGGGSGGSM